MVEFKDGISSYCFMGVIGCLLLGSHMRLCIAVGHLFDCLGKILVNLDLSSVQSMYEKCPSGFAKFLPGYIFESIIYSFI